MAEKNIGLKMGKYASKWRQWYIGDRTKAAGEKICEQADAEIAELEKAIRETLEENKHLADGDNCTLSKLKKVVNYEIKR